jgi:Zn ribbon nucleic-acid-binding protein
MAKFSSAQDHVLPRPLESLPTYARADARRSLAEKLVVAFKLSEAAADAIANAVVDPSAVRKTIGDPTDPQVEEIAVPGGMLFGIRTAVWSRRVMPDPRNPRIGPSRRHPFAIDPGSGGEESRFRPVPEPRSPEGKPETVPELVVELDSRLHLEWASAQAANYVLAENDWRDSIRSQGVMEAVWLVATTYLHADGSAPVTVLNSAEGSSRVTAVHNILEARSSDVPYEDPDAKLRTIYRRLNEAHERGTTTAEQAAALRCERMPALILVGFKPNATGTSGFPTAVKSLVALRHVDPPKPWGEGPANEALADEVLDELFRRSIISATERAYYAGSCTKAQARDAHLPDCPACRAARTIALFAKANEQTSEAVRIAVTSQSTRKRISKKLCNELAIALIVRSVANDQTKTDKVRRYLRDAFGQAVYNADWGSTGRDTETLTKEALQEVLRWIGDEKRKDADPGPSSLELAVRAAYPLIITGGLSAHLGSRQMEQPDRRSPSEVLEAMRRTVQGVHQLGQALRDFAAGQHIRAVEEDGTIKKRADGAGDLVVNDAYLRHEFPPAGKTRARSGGATPTEQLKDKVADLSEALDKLEESFKAVAAVVGNDGNPLVEVDGVDAQFCATRRQLLTRIGDELNFWGRTWRRRHGAPALPAVGEDDADENSGQEESEEEVEEGYDASYEAWDNAEKGDDEATA